MNIVKQNIYLEDNPIKEFMKEKLHTLQVVLKKIYFEEMW